MQDNFLQLHAFALHPNHGRTSELKVFRVGANGATALGARTTIGRAFTPWTSSGRSMLSSTNTGTTTHDRRRRCRLDRRFDLFAAVNLAAAYLTFTLNICRPGTRRFCTSCDFGVSSTRVHQPRFSSPTILLFNTVPLGDTFHLLRLQIVLHTCCRSYRHCNENDEEQMNRKATATFENRCSRNDVRVAYGSVVSQRRPQQPCP